MKVWVFLEACVILCGLKGGHGNHLAQRLIDDVIINRHYNPSILPVLNAADKVQVDFRLSLQEILGFDTGNGRVSARGWITMMWRDVYLQWDRRQYGDVEQLYLQPGEVWTPDLWLLNGVDFFLDMRKLAFITHTGSVFWKTTAKMTVTCDFWPDNSTTWRCPLEFSSWSYDAERLDLQFAQTDNSDDAHFKENPDFILVSVNHTREEVNRVKLLYDLEIEDHTSERRRRQKLLRKKKVKQTISQNDNEL